MSPPEPPPPNRPKQQIRPEPAPKILDEMPERSVLAQRRFDRPRSKTLAGGVAVIPVAPPAPREYAQTIPAAAHGAPTARPDTPVPASLQDDQAAVLRRELAAERHRRQEAERRLRVQAEAHSPATFPPGVSEPPGGSQAPSSSADGTIAALRKAQTRLLLGMGATLAALAAPLAIWLTNVAAEVKSRTERASVQVAQASNAAESAKKSTGSNDKELSALQQEFRQYRANMRELMRLQGVELPKHKGDPESDELKPVTPLCQPGKVCPGPQLILTNPP